MLVNFELVLLLFVIVFNASIAFVVYRDNPKSATNKIFFWLSFSVVFWLIASHYFRFPYFEDTSVIWARLAIFFAAPMSALFFLLAHTLPSEKLLLSKNTYYATIGAVVIMMLFNISPFAFEGIDPETEALKAGFGIIPFAIISTLFSILTLYFLIKKYLGAAETERKQIGLVLWGVFLMIGPTIITVLLPILLLNDASFVVFAPLYTMFFLGFTAYAIFKHHLFNIKILTTEIFTALIIVVSLLNFLSERDATGIMINILSLVAVLILGFLLVRGSYEETRSKEKIEHLAESLEKANEELKQLDAAKSEFVSIASHQLRTPLSIIKGYLSMAREGSFGKISKTMAKTLNRIYLSNERLIKLVNDLLDLSRMESGRMQYIFDYFDFREFINSMLEEFKLPATDKNIKISWSLPKESFKVWGDAQKLRQVIFNIIDNAIKYTHESGHIEIALKKTDDKVKLSVKDSGIGMSRETMDKLFKKFARGEKVPKINTEGAGLGLYVAKRIVEDHRGDIWADSEGEGTGSTFILELPIKNPEETSEQIKKFMNTV